MTLASLILFHILSVLRDSIKIPDIFGCTISGRGLIHTAKFPPLKLRASYFCAARDGQGLDELHLLLAENVDDCGQLPIDNSGAEELDRGCGRTLQRFLCDCISYSVRCVASRSWGCANPLCALSSSGGRLTLRTPTRPARKAERARLELRGTQLEEMMMIASSTRTKRNIWSTICAGLRYFNLEIIDLTEVMHAFWLHLGQLPKTQILQDACFCT
jgi:hypothetical protein